VSGVVRSGHIGNFSPEGILGASDGTGLVVEEPQIVMQEADKPDFVELCSIIHLTLEEFQSVDLAFDLPAARRRLEGTPHRR
jgi:hypothetical protein